MTTARLDRLACQCDTVSSRLTLAIILAASISGSWRSMLTGYDTLGLLGFVVSGVLGVGLIMALLRARGC